MWYLPAIRDTILGELVKTSPVSVSFKNDLGLSSHAVNCPVIGVYYSTTSDKELCIKILNTLNNNEKLACLLHEIGHANCDKTNCKCRHPFDRVKSETHAFEHTLKWLLKNKQKKVLRLEIKHIEELLDIEGCYSEAAKYVMDSKLWRKCLKYIGRL